MPPEVDRPRPAVTDQGAGDAESRLLERIARERARDRYRCARLRETVRRLQEELREARTSIDAAQVRAGTDTLTGLPNRQALEALAGEVRKGMPRGQDMMAVLFIDLDGFKAINDRLAHAAGDQVLRVIADRLAETVRHDDFVCRIGGDEFVCVLLDVHDEADARRVADKLLRHIAFPCLAGPESVCVRASIGIALHHRHGADVGQMSRRADDAMYAAKARGGGTAVA